MTRDPLDIEADVMARAMAGESPVYLPDDEWGLLYAELVARTPTFSWASRHPSGNCMEFNTPTGAVCVRTKPAITVTMAERTAMPTDTTPVPATEAAPDTTPAPEPARSAGGSIRLVPGDGDPPGSIWFECPAGTEVLRFDPDGTCKVYGEVVDTEGRGEAVFAALHEWLVNAVRRQG